MAKAAQCGKQSAYGVVYAILDPATGEARYIGRSTNLASRLRDHQKGRRGSKGLKEWLATQRPFPPWMILDKCEDEQHLFAAERAHIALARESGAPLLNVGHGGASGRFDHAYRRKGLRVQRQRGVSIYIPAEHLQAAGFGPKDPAPWYRVWSGPRGRVVVQLYREK